MSSIMGRPKKEISVDQFEKLCAMMCKKNEIVSFFDVSEDTLERWAKRTYDLTFAVVYKQKSDMGRITLRRAQFQKAVEGNVPLLIWLGKQMLGQRDQLETINENTNTERLTIILGGEHGKQKTDPQNSQPLPEEQS